MLRGKKRHFSNTHSWFMFLRKSSNKRIAWFKSSIYWAHWWSVSLLCIRQFPVHTYLCTQAHTHKHANLQFRNSSSICFRIEHKFQSSVHNSSTLGFRPLSSLTIHISYMLLCRSTSGDGVVLRIHFVLHHHGLLETLLFASQSHPSWLLSLHHPICVWGINGTGTQK